jgi:hypothetical protein
MNPMSVEEMEGVWYDDVRVEGGLEKSFWWITEVGILYGCW